jgi:hypothetical protein
MKRPYIAYFLLLILAIICTWSCTNDEGSSDIDILTPADSIQGRTEVPDLPQ